MEIKEAQQRYGDAIMQIVNKYAAVIGSSKTITKEEAINILIENINSKKVKDRR